MYSFKELGRYGRLLIAPNNFLGVLSILLVIFFAFWPNLFVLNRNEINVKSYEKIKKQLSPEAIDFLEMYKNEQIDDLKEFAKSIPGIITIEERNRIIDLVKNRPDYPGVSQFLISASFIVLIIFFVARELTAGRKFRIAQSINYLHSSIHIIRDNWDLMFPLEGFSRNVDDKMMRKNMIISLDYFEDFFSVVTGSPCRACIKVISPDKQVADMDDLVVKTFVRSSFAKSSHSRNDTKNDKIISNSDFCALAIHKERYWYIKDVDKERGYSNSHINIALTKSPSKQLGYKSTFTWPIRRHIDDGEFELFGFLCLDSKTSDVFDPRYDFDCGALVADFYYFLISIYINVLSANNNGAESD